MLSGSANAERSRYLLLDSRIIEKAENAKLSVGTVEKHKANPLFIEDKPWEKRFDNLYGNVIYDKEDRLYKCWYDVFIVDHSAKGMTLEQRNKRYRPPRGREMAICYATSKDGLTWEKPELGLVDYEGSKANNIVWRGPHGAGVHKDGREADPAHRYKMIMQGVKTSVSADGVKWSKAQNINLPGIAGDTHNNSLWAPTLGKYVGITRTWGKNGREVMRIESDDFKTWKKDKVVLTGTDKKKQTYAMPVFYYGGLYLGLVAVHHQRPVDRVWTELAWSPDTKEWHRIDEDTPLIPWSETKLDYDYGCVYPCAYPVFLENEIRIYYGGSDWTHYGWRNGCLALATLRPDGFAGYEQEATDKPAIIITKPVPYSGKDIRITADVDKGGSIRVSIVDDEGQNAMTAKTIFGTVTDEDLKLRKKVKLETIRLRFEIEKAKLYSFSFSE
jgi:hypothetical protein